MSDALRGARASLLLCSLFACLMWAFPQSSMASVADGRIGLSSHLFWLGEADVDKELKRMRTGGVDWIREDFRWDLIEPSQGNFDWRRTDGLMSAAARNDVNVLAILDYSARWASSDPSGRGDIHYPPREPADFARFAGAVAARYGANGAFWREHPGLPAKPLPAVEMWNEPWGWWFWKSGPDPARYARLAKAGAEAVKAVAPSTKVLISGDLLMLRQNGSASEWLGPVLDAEPSLRGLVDAYSTHPYPSPRDRSPLDTSSGPAYRFDRAHLTHDIAAARQADKPIWITEIGWSTAAAVGDAVTEDTQANYLRLAATSALGKQGVERMFVFGWDRSSGVAGDREGNYGLQRADGSMKPAWWAITSIVDNGLPPLPTVIQPTAGDRPPAIAASSAQASPINRPAAPTSRARSASSYRRARISARRTCSRAALRIARRSRARGVRPATVRRSVRVRVRRCVNRRMIARKRRIARERARSQPARQSALAGITAADGA